MSSSFFSANNRQQDSIDRAVRRLAKLYVGYINDAGLIEKKALFGNDAAKLKCIAITIVAVFKLGLCCLDILKHPTP